MIITFDEKVSKKIMEMKSDIPTEIVLDIDHTLYDGKELIRQDCCGVTRYRIVLINKNTIPPVFDTKIESNIGDVFFQKWALMYLDPQIKIRQNGTLIEIAGNGELIAPNIELVDFRK